MALGSLLWPEEEEGLAQGNDAAAGSRRGRSFERLEELCQKAAGTPPAPFWGVLWLCFVGLPSRPRTKAIFVFALKKGLLLLVGGDLSGSCAGKEASASAHLV